MIATITTAASFRRAAFAVLALAAAALPASGPARAGDIGGGPGTPQAQQARPRQQAAPRFMVINRSTQLVDTLNVSPSSSDQWGGDLLGLLQIPPGSAVAVNLPPGSECQQDVRVVFHDRSFETVARVDACAGQQAMFDGRSARAAQR